jgi:RNA polymerase sigma-70 factor (ECF subfamily)
MVDSGSMTRLRVASHPIVDNKAPFGPRGPDSTSTLLDRARAGDRAALDALFARCCPPLVRWARGRLPRWARDLADTQDVVQEAVLQTFKHLETIDARGEGALQAYLRQAVLNRIRDHIRRVERRPQATMLDSQHEDGGPSPLEQAVGAQAVERYEAALARLSDADRTLIVASVELGYSYEQLAEATERASPAAARKAARRALVKLAQEMARG